MLNGHATEVKFIISALYRLSFFCLVEVIHVYIKIYVSSEYDSEEHPSLACIRQHYQIQILILYIHAHATMNLVFIVYST